MEGHTFIALKAFTMGGTPYRPGDVVDVSQLAAHKLGQLLNQRYLRPGTPVSAATPEPEPEATDAADA